ncbi:PLP-dependent aminotransferase family protein [Pyrococcus sp. ST04]|uniref:aminotransferase-like domain-containing protein n=1 Tax=Pyrococcus sp. ST04 TaxID=1183377 RepID=UPI0002605E8B|nr:PLP-dependent aminotransferase family protein [Pyrococcus sp. ST04]AFK23212.1 aspartate aminotransferase [Pyrococcus sp. ST04]
MLSERIKAIDTTALKRVLDLISSGDVISFAGGVPSVETFPLDKLREIVEEVSSIPSAFQYGPSEGIPELREEIADYMKERWGAKTSAENVIITHGSQQGIDIVGRAMINPGDLILVEAPTYFVALNTFQVYEPKFAQIHVDENGLLVEDLEVLLKTLRPKILYTVPTFQNPTGTTLSEERRKYLVELAEEYNFYIVEDNPYGDIRYSGKKVKAIKAYSNDRVIYLGSFSKIFTPGFRIAWMVVPEELYERFLVAKQTIDVCTNSFGQYAAALFLRKGLLDEQIEKIVSYYKPKRDAMLEALEDYMPDNVSWTKPDGGMFVWATVEGVNTDELLERAVGKGVAYVPGSVFYAVNPRSDQMRLNFTFETTERIQEGIKRLAEEISS